MTPQEIPENRELLESAIERFEEAWLGGSRPRVEDHWELTPAGGISLLVELVYTDLEYRLKGGEPVRIEEYFQRFPELAEMSEHALGLIASEYRLRRRQEPDLTPQEYLERFPTHADSLAERFDQAAPSWMAPRHVPIPETIDHYRVLGVIARGGMGMVLRVHDPEFDRPLAMKVLLTPSTGPGDGPAERFFREARIAGRLQHPGIAPLHGMGRLLDGRPYFTMKLVEGHTLAELMADRASPGTDLPRYLGIFEQVCQTLAYAHSQGVVHRDLKPSNIMVGTFGEVQVMDWGLARERDDVSRSAASPESSEHPSEETPMPGSATRTGDVMGTPAFLSPEQAAGDPTQLGPATDVFGLGGLLCVLLTGKPPYPDTDVTWVLLQAKAGDLNDTHDRLDACGADLEVIQIAKRCLAVKPSDRFADAGEVARAVEHYQTQLRNRLREAELAQVRSIEERKRRRVRFALVVALLALSIGAGGAGVWYQRDRAERAIEAVHRERERLQRQEQDTQDAIGLLRQLTDQITQAEAVTGDGRKREQALRQARAEWARLEEVLNRPERPVSELVKLEADRVRPRLQAIEQDHALLGAFDTYREIRAQSDTLGTRFLDTEATDFLFQALREYELGIESIPVEDAILRINSRPRVIREQLIELFDVVLFECARTDTQREWLTSVLTGVDTNPLRSQLMMADDIMEVLTELDPSGYRPAFLAAVVSGIPSDRNPDKVAFLRRCVQHHGADFWLHFRLGSALVREMSVTFPDRLSPTRKEELTAALRHYTAATALRPRHALTHIFRGTTAHLLHEREEAESAYYRAIRLAPDIIIARVHLGALYLQHEQWDEALEVLTPLVGVTPETPEVYTNLGKAHHGKREFDRALAAFQKAIALDPAYATAHGALGALLAQQGTFDDALQALERAKDLAPEEPYILMNIGSALYLMGNFKRAEESYKAALAIDPDFAQAKVNLALVHVKRGRLQDAHTLLLSAVESDPTFGEAHFQLGNIKATLGDVTGASEAYRAALTAGKRSPEVYAGLSGALGSSGDYQGSLAAAEEAIRLAPRDALGHHNIGAAAHALGQLDRAEAAFRKAIEYDRSRFDSWANLTALLAQKGDFATTLVELKAMSQIAFAHPGAEAYIRNQITECERFIKLDAELDDILAGRVEPTTDELIPLAVLCQYYRSRPLDGLRFYEQAFAKNPRLVGDLQARRRFQAACCAVQAFIEGADAKRLTQGREWLRADLKALSTMSELSKQSHPHIRFLLKQWQSEPALTRLRQSDDFTKLPDDEREAWVTLWNDVNALLQKTNPSME